MHAEAAKSNGKMAARGRRLEEGGGGHLQCTINEAEANDERAQYTMDSGHDGRFGSFLVCSVMQSSETKLKY